MKENVRHSDFPVRHGGMERAPIVAEVPSRAVHVDKNIVLAGTPQNLIAPVPADALRRLVPEGDLPVEVDEIHPFLQHVQHLFKILSQSLSSRHKVLMTILQENPAGRKESETEGGGR